MKLYITKNSDLSAAFPELASDMRRQLEDEADRAQKRIAGARTKREARDHEVEAQSYRYAAALLFDDAKAVTQDEYDYATGTTTDDPFKTSRHALTRLHLDFLDALTSSNLPILRRARFDAYRRARERLARLEERAEEQTARRARIARMTDRQQQEAAR